MNLKQPLSQLLAKEVDRREFLSHIGAAGLGLIGITALIKALTDPQGKHSQKIGYGASAYGGERKLGNPRKLS